MADNVFGGFGGLLGQGLSQGFGQQQLQRQGTFGAWSGSNTSNENVFTIDCGILDTVKPQIVPGSETAVAWLDRRVDEMRVRL